MISVKFLFPFTFTTLDQHQVLVQCSIAGPGSSWWPRVSVLVLALVQVLVQDSSAGPGLRPGLGPGLGPSLEPEPEPGPSLGSVLGRGPVLGSGQGPCAGLGPDPGPGSSCWSRSWSRALVSVQVQFPSLVPGPGS